MEEPRKLPSLSCHPHPLCHFVTADSMSPKALLFWDKVLLPAWLLQERTGPQPGSSHDCTGISSAWRLRVTVDGWTSLEIQAHEDNSENGQALGTTVPRERVLTPGREPMTEQGEDTPKVQLSKPISFGGCLKNYG